MGSIQRVAFLCSVDPCHSIRYIRHKNKVFLCWVFTYIFIGAEDICPWQLYKQDAFSGSVNLPVNLVCRFRWISFAMTIGLKSGCFIVKWEGPFCINETVYIRLSPVRQNLKASRQPLSDSDVIWCFLWLNHISGQREALALTWILWTTPSLTRIAVIHHRYIVVGMLSISLL